MRALLQITWYPFPVAYSSAALRANTEFIVILRRIFLLFSLFEGLRQLISQTS
jgi:hypothetical protein